MLNNLYKMYFYVNKMQNMLLDDQQYPQHLPDLSIVLGLSISQVDIQEVKLISQTGIHSDYLKWYLEFCSNKCDEALNDFKKQGEGELKKRV